MIHGLLRKEVSDLHSVLDDAKEQSSHPLLVPLLLCQLLVDGDANGIRRHATDLYKVEFMTNFHGFSAPKSEVCIISRSHTLREYDDRAIATQMSQ